MDKKLQRGAFRPGRGRMALPAEKVYAGRMIWTVTPNPALDLSGVVDALVADEKNYVDRELRSPGGNAINAARVIHRLGVAVTATGFLGPSVGAEVRRLLEAEGLRTRFVPVAEDTRINVTVSNRATHHQTRLSFPGPHVTPAEFARLRTLLSRASPSLAVIGGSLPPGVNIGAIVRLMETLRRRRVETVLDVPGAILKPLLRARPILIKPNLEEFHALTGTRVRSLSAVIREARRLRPAPVLTCVSSVAGGAVLIGETRAWFGKTPPLRSRSSVGAGDSMVGAMAAKLLERRLTSREALSESEEGAELLRWGLAAACATLTTPGTQLGSAREILRFLPKIAISEVPGRGGTGD